MVSWAPSMLAAGNTGRWREWWQTVHRERGVRLRQGTGRDDETGTRAHGAQHGDRVVGWAGLRGRCWVYQFGGARSGASCPMPFVGCGARAAGVSQTIRVSRRKGIAGALRPACRQGQELRLWWPRRNLDLHQPGDWRSPSAPGARRGGPPSRANGIGGTSRVGTLAFDLQRGGAGLPAGQAPARALAVRRRRAAGTPPSRREQGQANMPPGTCLPGLYSRALRLLSNSDAMASRSGAWVRGA